MRPPLNNNRYLFSLGVCAIVFAWYGFFILCGLFSLLNIILYLVSCVEDDINNETR